jgi:hypothetical protein
MVYFITVLRALAACLVTNSHYSGFYPVDFIAKGGMVGNVLFFCVSGYCLYNIKNELSISGFTKWYGKRVWRIYLPVIIITAVYMILNQYSMDEQNFVSWYIYPTGYHFVASIVSLYIPFYFFMKIKVIQSNLKSSMILVGCVWLVIYIFFYDKSYYHIDIAQEPMIRFLFFNCMLLGAWFRQNEQKFRNNQKNVFTLAMAIIFVALHYITKHTLLAMDSMAFIQPISIVLLFIHLYYLFRLFVALNDKLEKIPLSIKKVINFISRITLEIYIVQYVIIDFYRGIVMPFPINWLLLTTTIIVVAYTLNRICAVIYKSVDKTLLRLKTSK